MPPPASGQGQDQLIFEVSQRCNLKCRHCYNVWEGTRPYPRGQLSTTQTIELLDRALDQTRATRVTLTGGEPLLREDLPRLIDALRRRQVQINLITNGQLLTDRALDRLPAAEISIFELPLLSDEAAIFDDLAGHPGAFDRATEAMARLKLRGATVVGVFVATRLNLSTLPGTLDLALALGLDGVMFNRFNPGGRGLENLEQLQASPEQLSAALDQAQAFVREFALPISCAIPMPPCLLDHIRWPDLGFGHCAAGTDGAYYSLDPLGNLRPCNHSPTILGNLMEQKFQDIVASEVMARFTEACPAFCQGCEHEDTSKGGCKAAAEAACGDISAMDPFLAAFNNQAMRPARRKTSR